MILVPQLLIQVYSKQLAYVLGLVGGGLVVG